MLTPEKPSSEPPPPVERGEYCCPTDGHVLYLAWISDIHSGGGRFASCCPICGECYLTRSEAGL